MDNDWILKLIPMSNDSTDLDYLEQIYKKVRLDEWVQFNGKGYVRVTPKNNKYFKCKYHFHCFCNDVYSGNVKTNNNDGEMVSTCCKYKAIIIT